VPYPPNEPILEYRKGSPERVAVEKEIAHLRSTKLDIPIIIGGKEIRTSNPTGVAVIPHQHAHVLATVHQATADHVKQAIEESLRARAEWAAMPFDHRVAVFMKAADLLAGPWRAKVMAATMLGQSKNLFQAEIDCSCELIDFWRFNARMRRIFMNPSPTRPRAPGIASPTALWKALSTPLLRSTLQQLVETCQRRQPLWVTP